MRSEYFNLHQARHEKRHNFVSVLFKTADVEAHADTFDQLVHQPLALAGSFQGNWIKWFDGAIYIAVVVNSIQLGLEVDLPGYDWVYTCMDTMCFMIFFLEIFVKMSVLGCVHFFHDWWNCLNVFLLVVNIADYLFSMLGSLGPLVLLRMLRLCRIARVFRMFRVFKELLLIFSNLLNAMRTVMWFTVFLATFIYAGSLVCVTVIQETSPETFPGADENFASDTVLQFNPYKYFGNVPDSMYTLFNLILMAEFSEFARAIYLQQKGLFIFLLFFVVMGTFSLLNILLAGIIETTLECAKQLEDDFKSEMDMTRAEDMLQLTRMLDNDGRQVAPPSDALGDPGSEAHDKMNKMMQRMGFPVCFTPDEMYTVLGGCAEDSIGLDKFRTNALRLAACDNNPFEWHCLVILTLNQILEKISMVDIHLGASLNSSRRTPKWARSKSGTSEYESEGANGASKAPPSGGKKKKRRRWKLRRIRPQRQPDGTIFIPPRDTALQRSMTLCSGLGDLVREGTQASDGVCSSNNTSMDGSPQNSLLSPTFGPRSGGLGVVAGACSGNEVKFDSPLSSSFGPGVPTVSVNGGGLRKLLSEFVDRIAEQHEHEIAALRAESSALASRSTSLTQISSQLPALFLEAIKPMPKQVLTGRLRPVPPAGAEVVECQEERIEEY